MNIVDILLTITFLVLFIYIIRNILLKKIRAIKINKNKKILIDNINQWNPKPLFEPTKSDNNQIIPKINNNNNNINNDNNNINVYYDDKIKDLYSYSYYNFSYVSDKNVDGLMNIFKNYGIGSCGPRAFYGSMVPHLELEELVTNWMKCGSSILYPSIMSIQISILSALGDKKSLIIYDEDTRCGSKLGAKLSRSKVIEFFHNDMEDLDNKLYNFFKNNKNNQIKERLIFIEGIYLNSGIIANLPKILELSNKYKLKIILDDTYAIGVLGNNGRGSWEHYYLKIDNFYCIFFGLDSALGSMGAICYSKGNEIIKYQRLNGSGYTFSASIPPYLAYNAISSLNILIKDFDFYSNKLKNNIRFFMNHLKKITMLQRINLSTVKNSYNFSILNNDSNNNIYSPIINIYVIKKINQKDQLQLLTTLRQTILEKLNISVSIQKTYNNLNMNKSYRLRIILKYNIEQSLIESLCSLIFE
jgi:serine palmitoyltransferase